VRFRAPTCVHGASEPFLFEMRTVFSGAPCIRAPGNAGAPMGMGYATTPLIEHPQEQNATPPIGCLKVLLNCHWLLLKPCVGIENMFCLTWVH
jgi:hypothetical protein